MFPYKLAWLLRLRRYFERHFSPEEPLLWAGDFNVAPEPIDVHDPVRLLGHVGFHPEEHQALACVKAWGFVDVFRKHEPNRGQYTFWDCRAKDGVARGTGWRVDHVWATRPLAAWSLCAWIDVEPRIAERPSDHTVLAAEFDLWPSRVPAPLASADEEDPGEQRRSSLTPFPPGRTPRLAGTPRRRAWNPRRPAESTREAEWRASGVRSTF